jgi:hypothetical protein
MGKLRNIEQTYALYVKPTDDPAIHKTTQNIEANYSKLLQGIYSILCKVTNSILAAPVF